MNYVPPVATQRYVLETIADIAGLARLPAFGAASSDVIDAVLTGAARISRDILAPLNRIGDVERARLENGVVRLPDGFREAWRSLADGGWIGLAADPEYGGQGLPFVLSCAVMEQFTAANMSFALLPMLTLGGIEALQAHGTPEQKKLWLAPLIAGRWSSTMVLTEPQAGSDVGALRTEARPATDGTWRIRGQKIFTTWGEHELTENIVHFVLARTPGAPDGTRGISLFIVPRYHPADGGGVGARNDVRATALEHKLGIHASPTCVMSFGDNDACVAHLVGPLHGGMAAMFTMMNHARINVGTQGFAMAERALQHAAAYAAERVQSARFGGPRAPVAIIEHMDVRRMLATGRGLTEAARAIGMLNAAAVDRAHAESDSQARAAAQGVADLLTPITKAFSTDIGVEVSSMALQIFGGMGYMEEAGAAQFYRDARIAPIYEGTNGIQALDLVGRKLLMEGGAHWRALLQRQHGFVAGLKQHGLLRDLHPGLDDALRALEAASIHLADAAGKPDDMAATATPYLRMFGLVLGGLLLAQQAVAAADRLREGEGDSAFLNGRMAIARYYCEQILPLAPAMLGPITAGAESLQAIATDALAATI